MSENSKQPSSPSISVERQQPVAVNPILLLETNNEDLTEK
jgi:hypothetical protein